MASKPGSSSLTTRQVLSLAWPIILANAAAPLLGLVDTAVIGHAGATSELGAIAVGSMIFNFVYWTFGFLRMGTTGFVAQASGSSDQMEVRATAARALLLAGLIGAALVALQWPTLSLALLLLDPSSEVASAASDFFNIRIWGAPAGLANAAIFGVLIGLGKTPQLLRVQVLLNGMNAVLDGWFAGLLGWGVQGIAWGTVLSEWFTLLFALALVSRLLRSPTAERAWPAWSRVLDKQRLSHLLSANRDIMLRTLALLFAFGLFTRQGARFGDAVLAGNHVLLQLVSFSAFFLDGFANVAETLVGHAIGRRDRVCLHAAVVRSSQLSAVAALVLAAIVALVVPLSLLSDQPEVLQSAQQHRAFAGSYVLLSFAAFQLDGVFIGAARAADMRNAAILSLLGYLAAWWVLVEWARLGNAGLWLAFNCYVVARAAALLVRYRRVLAMA